MNEIQVVPDKKEIIEKYLTLVALKEKTTTQINSLEVIYKTEILEAKKLLHRTKDGQMVYIPNMGNDHLLNTIRILARGGLQTDTAQKYVQEAKNRGLINELTEIISTPQAKADDDNNDNDEYADYLDNYWD